MYQPVHQISIIMPRLGCVSISTPYNVITLNLAANYTFKFLVKFSIRKIEGKGGIVLVHSLCLTFSSISGTHISDLIVSFCFNKRALKFIEESVKNQFLKQGKAEEFIDGKTKKTKEKGI